MSSTSVLAFWAVAAILVVVPGPDWAFTLGTTTGGRPVLAVVTGLVIGYAVLTAAVSAGVGAVVASSPLALSALTVVGGCYLMWQGIVTVRHPATDVVSTDVAPASRRATVVRGIGVSSLNPKALLLFVALLPQFTQPSGSWPIPAQLALLGGVFTLTCAAFYLLLGSVAGTVLRARPAAARAVSRVSGACMVLIGALLVVEHLAT